MSENIDKNLIVRPPIVVIMGHIDHGKTKLLDTIRKTNVIDRESGGITQHIGAYEITFYSEKNPEFNKRRITFIDTPGHEAFSLMREQGAETADIAILIVAADEGVKAQTKEALKTILDSKIPFFVAINKIDRPEANPERVKQQLAELGVYLEGWGGHVPFVLISAKENTNIEELLEMVLLMADMEELKGDQSVPASGIVIEAKMDSRKGVVVSLIIKNGTLKVGDEIVTSSANGKIKIIEDCKARKITEATFSAPVLVFGFKELPKVGEEFATGDLIADFVKAEKKIFLNHDKQVSSVDAEKDINLIVKVDVAGSLDALQKIIGRIKIGERNLQIIDANVGDINSSDIRNAEATGSWILGFRVKMPKDLESTVLNKKIKYFLFDVIYEVEKFFQEEIDKIISNEKEKKEGEFQILACFSQRKNDQVVGGRMIKGKFVRGNQFKVIRGEQELGTGKITNIQVMKKDMKEVEEGKEAGFNIDCGVEIKTGDKLVLLS
ncbi:MAG TPA: translation initiation factor IF-2 [Candidatus Paceibacterota bacterium]|nr:translation initiation factor IF-2 [Candidatus Paceibacterota bacterium]HPT39990.1 translation initiation factor IF-2 [Candidatus Paceibacterota bacterium]